MNVPQAMYLARQILAFSFNPQKSNSPILMMG